MRGDRVQRFGTRFDQRRCVRPGTVGTKPDHLHPHRRVDGREPLPGAADQVGVIVDSGQDQQANLVEQAEAVELPLAA